MEPLFSRNETRNLNLRLLLGSICLRRNKTQIQIPSGEEVVIPIILSDDERTLYSRVLKDSKKAMDGSVSSRSLIKNFANLFATILKLTRICNHGTHQHISPLDSKQLANAPIESMVNVLTPGQNKACDFCDIHALEKRYSIDLTTCNTCLATLCDACIDKHDFLCGQYLESESYNFNPESTAQTSTGRISLPTYGYSTKLSTVAENIERNLQHTKR